MSSVLALAPQPSPWPSRSASIADSDVFTEDEIADMVRRSGLSIVWLDIDIDIDTASAP